MRLSEGRIKEAILSSDMEVRSRAIQYFADCFSPDAGIMPLVIQSVETFGRAAAYHTIGPARHLPQTDGTLSWVLDELNAEHCGDYENYAYNLSMLLAEADTALLLSRESEVLAAKHFRTELGEVIADRLGMLSWSEARCWQALEDVCESGRSREYSSDIDWPRGKQIVEALARFGNATADKVHSLLVDDYTDHPMKWMEPLAVRLAGMARLESNVPVLVAKLHEDADLLQEESARALAHIGTPEVVQSIAQAYPKSPEHFRVYAIGVLERVPGDLAVATCLKLLDQEQLDRHQLRLAEALLSQFALVGIEVARLLLLGRSLDFDSRGLRDYLLTTCGVMQETFPEHDEWLAEMKLRKQEHWDRMRELNGDPGRMLLYALQKLTGREPPVIAPADHRTDLPQPARADRGESTLAIVMPESRRNVGRNDRCPCGSGKKFKHCCLKQQ